MLISDLTSYSYVMPAGGADLDRFELFARERKPFTFVRFSDGEIEILRNRKLVIANGVTEFKGLILNNQYPVFDQKRFDPRHGQDVRRDLLESAMYNDDSYFKGIPARHNNMLEDREFMLRLNGGFTPQMTFSDLFLNGNVIRSRNKFFPFLMSCFEDIVVVGNWRCELKEFLSRGQLIQIPDDFFTTYKKTLDNVLEALLKVPQSAIILSSASSLSNVLGYRLRLSRPDLTFLDIGTVLNDFIGLPLGTRSYHKSINPHSLSERIAAWRYRWQKEYQLKW
jgi:hypothetical protein